ncbi:hypothetical protein JMUB7546_26750 [Staphylococcus aureus]
MSASLVGSEMCIRDRINSAFIITNMKYNKNINTLVEIFFERIAEIKPAHNPPMPYNISEKPNCTDESFKTL